MNPFQKFAQWLDHRADESYRSKPDPYLRDELDPFRKRLAEREARLARGQSFITDYMRGEPPRREDDR